MAERHFTLEEATELLSWLREQFRAIRPLQSRIERLAEEIQELMNRVGSNGATSLEAEIGSRRRELDRLEGRLNRRVQAITEKGISVRDVARGLVDFPSLREGAEVYLCWLVEEERIGYWHPTDTGFSSRQPL